jgi:hypothetical protein
MLDVQSVRSHCHDIEIAHVTASVEDLIKPYDAPATR